MGFFIRPSLQFRACMLDIDLDLVGQPTDSNVSCCIQHGIGSFCGTSDFVGGISICSVKSVGGSGKHTRDLSHMRRRGKPLHHGGCVNLTYLSWYLWSFSIHYI